MENGAEKLLRRMHDREYAEMADCDDHDVFCLEDALPDEDSIDETKDVEIKGR